MAVTMHDSVLDSKANMTDIKAEAVVKELECHPSKPPVDDNFMYDFKYNHVLPSSDVLGIEVPTDCDAQREAEDIVARLSQTMGAGDAQAFAEMFLPYGVWRDKLSFTWDYRTFNFHPAIFKAATDLFPKTKATNFKFLTPAPTIARPYPDFAQLQFVVSFETEVVTMHTVAEKLKQFPEVPPSDGHMTGPISWEKQRAAEIDAANPEISFFC